MKDIFDLKEKASIKQVFKLAYCIISKNLHKHCSSSPKKIDKIQLS